VDAATGALVVKEVGRRLNRVEVEAIREAQAAGHVVVFKNRHQWRHFQRTFS
jgi:hypothetical protein